MNIRKAFLIGIGVLAFSVGCGSKSLPQDNPSTNPNGNNNNNNLTKALVDCNGLGIATLAEFNYIKFLWQNQLPADACPRADTGPLPIRDNRISDAEFANVQTVFNALTAQDKTALASDCNENGHVTQSEVLVGVDINLGNRDISACFAADLDGDLTVEIDENVSGSNAARTNP